MPGPQLPTVYTQSMTERINEYYGSASIFKNNMFFVGLWGEYVQSAIGVMEASTTQDPFLGSPRSDQTLNVDIYGEALKRWKGTHWEENNLEVELKWTCKQIKIPTVESETKKDEFSIDTIKPINYSLTQHYGGVGVVTLTIVEDRNKMLWHFFNTLHNQFYDAQFLTPKSSFHKLGMYCAVIQGDALEPKKIAASEKLEGIKYENGTTREKVITDVPAMVYEFNSAVVTNVGGIEYSQESPGMFTFTVSIEVPNTFQGTFKTQFRGLANNTDSKGGYAAGSGVDSSSIQNGTYIKGFFESEIDTVSNGSGNNVRRNSAGQVSNVKGGKSQLNTNQQSNVQQNIRRATN